MPEVTRITMADSSDQGYSLMVWGVFTDVCESLEVAAQHGGFAHLTLAEKGGPANLEWCRGDMVMVNPRQIFDVRPAPLTN